MATDKATPANLASQNSAFAANFNDSWMVYYRILFLVVPLLFHNSVIGLFQTLIGGIAKVASLRPAKNIWDGRAISTQRKHCY